MHAQFDHFAEDYAGLLLDPIREYFAPEGTFFQRRKLDVLQDFCRSHGREPRSMRWLDVGCGRGELLRLGQPHFAEAAGCDLSAAMLKACGDLPVRPQESPESVPYATGAFDLVTLVCVLHHVAPSQRPAVLAEAARVMRPDGLLCLVEHNPLNPVTRLIVSRTPVDAGARLLSARIATRALRAAGLAVVTVRYFLYSPERFYHWLARLEDWVGALPLGGQYALCGRKQRLAHARTTI